MLREYIPKGLSLRSLSYARLTEVAAAINQRPRKTMGYDTPEEAIFKELNPKISASGNLVAQ